MAYATQANITDRYSAAFLLEVADRDRSGVVDAASITAALEDGAAEIDLYIGQAYDLPLSTVPAYLVLANVEISVYRLAYTADVLTEAITKRYEAHIKRLELMACGKLSLGVTDAESDSVDVTIESDDREFSRSKLSGLM